MRVYLTESEAQIKPLIKMKAKEYNQPEHVVEPLFFGPVELVSQKIGDYIDQLELDFFIGAIETTPYIEDPLPLFADYIFPQFS